MEGVLFNLMSWRVPLEQSVRSRKEVGRDLSGGSHGGKSLAEDLETERDAEMGGQPRRNSKMKNEAKHFIAEAKKLPLLL